MPTDRDREPDWKRLYRIADEAARRSQEPGWDRRRWNQLQRRAVKATNGHPHLTEFMARFLPQ